MAKRIKIIDMKRPEGKASKPGPVGRLFDKIIDKVFNRPAPAPDPEIAVRFRAEAEAIIAELRAQGHVGDAPSLGACLNAFPFSATEYEGDLAIGVRSILTGDLSAPLRARLKAFQQEYLSKY